MFLMWWLVCFAGLRVGHHERARDGPLHHGRDVIEWADRGHKQIDDPGTNHSA